MFKLKKSGTKETSIVIGYPTLRIALPVFVAQKKGYFKEQGLNVSLKSYETAQPLVDALVSGKIDIGGFCALPITFAAMARSKTKLLFLGGMYEDDDHPISFLIVKPTMSIKTIKDLKGKIIGILPTRAYEVWLQQILVLNDVNPNDVIIKQVSPYLQVDALNSGSVHALFTNDPAATITILKGFGKLLIKGALFPKLKGKSEFYFGSFNIRKDFADNNPKTVRNIALALDKASKYIEKKPYDAQETMKEYLLGSHQEFVGDFQKSKFVTSNEVSDEDLKTIKDYYLEQQVLPVNIETKNLQYNYITMYSIIKSKINGFFSLH